METANFSSERGVVDRLAIARLGQRGDGIADTAEGAVYVPYTLPGETVEAQAWPGHPDRRHLVRVDVPSSDRIAPICPHFGVCGGCALQHWRAPNYRAWKRDLVVAALSYVGLDTTVDDLVDAHGEGRRRAVFHARRGTKDILQVGFAAFNSHHIVAIDHCPILAPGLGGALEAAWAIAETLGATAKPLDIQVTATDAGLDIDLRGSGPLTTPQSIALARLAESRGLARRARRPPGDADDTDGPRRGGAAPRCVPAGHGRGRGEIGAPGRRPCGRRPHGRRPICRCRPVRPETSRARPDHRGRR
jgi:23S rRNA (uracil1939-C5)-methyltransferase